MKENQIPEIKGFRGHIVLYCKMHYKTDTNFVQGLRNIWCIRCGLPNQYANGSIDEYIANSLFEIRRDLGYNHPSPHEMLHKELTKPIFFEHEDVTPIEKLIRLYVSDIQGLQIRKKVEGTERWDWLFKLPKPQKRVMKRIINGKGEYDDYKLIEK